MIGLKMKKKLLSLGLLIFASGHVFADNGSAGHFVLKGKLHGIFSTTHTKIADTSPYNNINLKWGQPYGIEVAGTYFISDNLGAELNLSLANYKFKLRGAGGTSGDASYPTLDKSLDYKVYGMPVAVLIQYYPAPYGKIVPYVGVGLHYYSFVGAGGTYSIKNKSGIVFQGGFNTWINKNYFVNFEIKKYTFSTSITYQTPPNIYSNLTLNPLTVALGVGYRF